MLKHFVSGLLFSILIFFSSQSSAQSNEDVRVMHVQTMKLKSFPSGDDEAAFDKLLKKRAQIYISDPRVLSSVTLRHHWGHDNRDLVLILEFKNRGELFSFYDELNSMFEEALTEEDNQLWDKYIDHHADEIYQEVPGTRK